MEYIQNGISEESMDFAIISSFTKNQKIADLFLNQIKRKGKVTKVLHSHTQMQSNGSFGESDIIFILIDNNNNKFAIFIEDKINADAMPNQRIRYTERAESLGQEEGFNDDFYIFLCAPQKYIDSSKNEGYDLYVSYENILDYTKDNLLKSMFYYCINEKHLGYTVIEDESITEFWNDLYAYIDSNYGKEVNIYKVKGSRGSKACWPTFITNIDGLVIRWKTDRDIIDLEFSNMADNKYFIIHLLKDISFEKYELCNTGKSASLRYYVPASKHVEFGLDFNDQISNVDYALSIVCEFYKLARKIEYKNVFKFPI